MAAFSDPGSSRRPGHVPSAQQVDVQMFNSLPTIGSCIDDTSIAPVQVQRARQFGDGSVHVADQCIVRPDSLSERNNVAARNDQYMRRRLRVHVGEGHHLVIFKQQLCRDFSGSDFAENTIHTRQHSAPAT